MSMFDDLDPAFDPNAPDALDKVAARVHQLRVRRRLTFGGIAGALVAVTVLTSAAFALNDDSNGGVRVEAPVTSTTPQVTTSTIPTPSTAPPTGPVPLPTAPRPAGDSVSVVTVEPSTLTMTEGDEVTVAVVFKNDGRVPVPVYEGPCQQVDVPDPVPCAKQRAEMTSLGPGALLAYPVTVRSSPDWRPDHGGGSFTIPFAFNGVATSLPVTVLEGVSASISPTNFMAQAGIDAVTTVYLHNESNTEQGLGYAPDGCGLSIVRGTRPCGLGLPVAGVGARSDASQRVSVNTTGAKPGVYTVKIDHLDFTVTVVA